MRVAIGVFYFRLVLTYNKQRGHARLNAVDKIIKHYKKEPGLA